MTTLPFMTTHSGPLVGSSEEQVQADREGSWGHDFGPRHSPKGGSPGPPYRGGLKMVSSQGTQFQILLQKSCKPSECFKIRGNKAEKKPPEVRSSGSQLGVWFTLWSAPTSGSGPNEQQGKWRRSSQGGQPTGLPRAALASGHKQLCISTFPKGTLSVSVHTDLLMLIQTKSIPNSEQIKTARNNI